MIKDYLKIFTEEKLSIFLKNSVFFSHIHKEDSGMIIAYYNYEVSFEDPREEKGYIIFKLPSWIDEITEELLKLGAIKNTFRESNAFEDPTYVLENVNLAKIELLKNILYNQKMINNHLEIDKTINYLEKNNIRPYTILKLLDLEEDELLLFNDLEILVHAVAIKYPEKINKINSILNNQSIKIEENTKVAVSNSIKTKKNIKIAISNSIKIHADIIYNIDESFFSNTTNGKEYNIKGHGDYDIMMKILIKNKGKYIPYKDFSELKVMNKKKDDRDINKRLTDTKDNLIKNIKRNLYIKEKLIFIEVNNGLKISIK